MANTESERHVNEAFQALKLKKWELARILLKKAEACDSENAMVYVGFLLLEAKVESLDALCRAEKPFWGEKSYYKAIQYGDDELKNKLEQCKYEAICNKTVTMFCIKGYPGCKDKEIDENLLWLKGYSRLDELKTYYENIIEISNSLYSIKKNAKYEIAAMRAKASPYIFMASAFIGHFIIGLILVCSMIFGYEEIFSPVFSSIGMDVLPMPLLFVPFIIADAVLSAVILPILFGINMNERLRNLFEIIDFEDIIIGCAYAVGYLFVGAPLVIISVALAPIASIVYLVWILKRKKDAKELFDLYFATNKDLLEKTAECARTLNIIDKKEPKDIVFNFFKKF